MNNKIYQMTLSISVYVEKHILHHCIDKNTSENGEMREFLNQYHLEEFDSKMSLQSIFYDREIIQE